MVRVTLGGPELEGFPVPDPAASVRLLLPPPGSDRLVMPEWNSNEFLLPGGDRAVIRTFTPRRVDPAAGEMDLDVVLHDGGVASRWVEGAEVGTEGAISGPGRGYEIDTAASDYVLGGDETAIPAITQLLESLPAEMTVFTHIEVARPDARIDLPDHPNATVRWHDQPDGAPPGGALVAAIEAAEMSSGTKIWAAGEAAAMQRLRRHLFESRGLDRGRANVRGYWKHGRAGS